MPARRQVVVIGLGRFGTAVATTLARIGHEVLAVDTDERRVQEISASVTHAVQADGANAESLQALGISHFDTGIVGVSEDIARSILVTVQLKRAGVRTVIAKAQDDVHAEALEKVGADRVVLPEREVGERLAHSFTVPNVLDYMPLGPDYGVVKLEPPASCIGQTLGGLDLPGRYGVVALLIERRGQALINPGPEERVRPGDLFVLAGMDEAMERLRSDTRPDAGRTGAD